MDATQLKQRLAVVETGPVDGQPMVFVHGYATSQEVWRHVAPAFEDEFRVIRYDHPGAGRSDRSAWDARRHASLHGYAGDLLALAEALELTDVILVGHSVGGMVAALAVGERPGRFSRLVMVAPSARFLDDDGYVGGFSREQIDSLLVQLDDDFPGWARAMAPHLVGDAPEPVARELEDLMTSAVTPEATRMARAFMLSDYRDHLRSVTVPTLVAATPNDPFVPTEVTDYVERHLPDGHLVQLGTSGHFPVLSHPGEVIAAIRAFVDGAGWQPSA